VTGICGWTNGIAGQHEADAVLKDMASRLRYGAKGEYFFASAGGHYVAGVGRTDNTVVYAGDRVLLACHGEISWSDDALRRIAAEQGHGAALEQAYLRHGHSCLEDVHGTFGLVLIDLTDGSILLAVDRLGIQPLCYSSVQDQLIFASGATAVAAHPATTDAIDAQAIFDYLYFHMVPSPRSIFSGQEKLLPGQYVRFADGKSKKGFYWQLAFSEESQAPFPSLCQELHATLSSCVDRAIGAKTVGAFLSGGTDSSTIMGKLGERSGNPARAYSIGFDAPGFDEMTYARIAARHFRALAHEYYVTPQDVVDAVPLVARAYDEPFGNASAVPAYYCARMAAADGVHTMLAGDGGDEIFGGNARYVTQLLFDFYSRIPEPLRGTVIEPLAFGVPGIGKLLPVRKLRGYITQAKAPMPDRMESYNFLQRTPLTDIFEDGFLEMIDQTEPLNNVREVYNRTHSTSMLNRMLHMDLKITLADNDLRKVNRMCELAGVDVRYPLLDEAMVEFSGRVPPALKIRHLRLRYFFKRAMRDFLPREILTKKKHGFGLPFGLWLQTHPPLRDLAHDSITSLKRRGYVKPTYIDWLLHQHRSEHATYYGVMIWVLMMLEQWLAANGR